MPVDGVNYITMKKTSILSLLSLALVFLASSCAQQTPQSRIQANPALFAKIPDSQKQSAKQGRIKKGMTKDAVFIAWGKPHGVTSGNRNGKDFENWVYTRSTPVYRNGFYSRVGYGWGGYGRRGRGWGGPNYGVGFNPGVRYVQRTAASVSFDHRHTVKEWTSVR